MEEFLDKKEIDSLDRLNERYEKLTKPSQLAKLEKNAVKIIPNGVKNIFGKVGESISEQELYMHAMNQISNGFKIIEQQAVRLSISEQQIEKVYKSEEVYTDIKIFQNLEVMKFKSCK